MHQKLKELGGGGGHVQAGVQTEESRASPEDGADPRREAESRRPCESEARSQAPWDWLCLILSHRFSKASGKPCG